MSDQLALDITAPPEQWVTPYGDVIPSGTLTARYAYDDPGFPTRVVYWDAAHLTSPTDGADRVMSNALSYDDYSRDGDTVTYHHPHGGTTTITFEEAP